jgi:hypothetical protein
MKPWWVCDSMSPPLPVKPKGSRRVSFEMRGSNIEIAR